jgi:hypothetical protein
MLADLVPLPRNSSVRDMHEAPPSQPRGGVEGGAFRRLIRNVSGRSHTYPMTEEEHAILSFEETQLLDMAHHDEVVRQRFGMTRATYAQRLGRLIVRPDVIAAFPVLVHRLERQHTARLARRDARARRRWAA